MTNLATTETPDDSAERDVLTQEVLAGLKSDTKHIAPKYFYDKKGAELFDAITELDEYYVTRVEEQIVKTHRDEICDAIGNDVNLVEPGAGSCEKVRWLLPALNLDCYTPMDISVEHLQQSAEKLRDEYPELTVVAQPCDHTQGIDLDANPSTAPRVFFYPGSSIGNFEPAAAVNFLQAMRAEMAAGGGLLIGVDTKKDNEVLHAAYNDSEGVTAEFNLNVLDHLNTVLDGTLARDKFRHVARYAEDQGRIEMYLECTEAHSATLDGERLEFAEGERVHTENSYKYLPDEFAELAAQAGFARKALWQDDAELFSVMYFEAA